ncbi:MAG: GNAT family N-acetyltransferase [Melioribacteraceae bacterium]|nr:GNAT family N-acetyltransferase [Melioribacteraceae bacterium]
MFRILRTDSANKDFVSLVKSLDEYLTEMDGEEHSFYDQFNKVDNLKFVVILYENNFPIGCGAIKEYTSNSMEIKRMFTLPEKRGKGIASKILIELEKWSLELNYEKCILETGKRQIEAIGLYSKCGYKIIPNFGQYKGIENSLCFEKQLK